VASDSLARLCSRLHAATGTLLSHEGLNKRLNAKAVLFLKHIFSLLLEQKVCEQTQISNHLFSYFQRIRILDATVFQVSNALENVYPGSGGCAQTAGIKIQLAYDLHNGKLIAIFLCSSTMFKMRQLLLQKKKRELSEYKAIGMIQDHLYLLYQAIQKDTQEITKILIHLFHLLQKNGRKSHRYEKKTVFDIMGVV
ncbi:transposase, partial [Bacillus mycoides]